MIGTHELLLIIRGQNQASAAMGRVARDLRKLQTMQDMRSRQASLQNKAASDLLRLQQIESDYGSRNLSIRRAQLATENQIEAVRDRSVSIEQRRAAIVARAHQIQTQELRLQNRLVDQDAKRLGLEKRRQQLKLAELTTAGRIADLSRSGGVGGDPAGLGRQTAQLRAFNANTQVIKKELARSIQSARLAASEADSGEDPVGRRRMLIAEREVTAARRAAAIAAGQYRQLDSEIERLNKTLKINRISLKEVDFAMDNLGREATEIRAMIARLEDAWTSLSARERSVQAAEAQHARQLAELQLRLKGVEAQAMETAAAAGILRNSINMTNDELALSNRIIADQKWEKLATGARAVSHFGRVAQMAGLVSVAAFGMAANAAANLNTQATLAGTQMSNTAAQMVTSGEKIQSAITEAMMDSTSSAEGLSASIYEIFSGTDVGTLPVAQALAVGTKQMKLMSDAAIAGQTDIQDVTQLTIQVMNNFGGTMQHRLEQMFSAVRYGRLTFDEYAESLSQLIPASASVGQTFNDMNAAFAFATRNLGVSFARTGLARLYEFLDRPEAQKGLQQLGVNIEDATGKMRPLHEIMQDLAAAAPELVNGTKGIQEFAREITKAGGASVGQGGTIQMARVWQVLVSHAQDYMKVTNDVKKNHDQFTEQLRAMEQTTGVQWDKFINQLKSFVLVVGHAALPALLKFGSVIGDIAEWFTGLSDETKKSIGYFGAAIAVITLFAGTLATVGGALIAMGIGLRALRAPLATLMGGKGAGGASKAVAALGTEAGFISKRFTVIASAVIILLPFMESLTGSTDKLTAALKLLSIALTALAIRSLFALLARAAAARIALTGLALVLGTVGSASASTVVAVGLLSYALSKIIRAAPRWEEHFRGIGATIYDLTHGGEDTGTTGITATLAKDATEASILSNKIRSTILAVRAAVNKFKKAGMTDESVRMSIENLFPQLSEEELNTWVNLAISRYDKAKAEFFRRSMRDSRMPAPLEFETAAKVAAATGPFTDAEFKKAFARVEALRKAAEKAPSWAGFQRYHAALAAMNKRASDDQKAIMADLKAAMDALNKDTATISNAEFQRRSKQLETLRKQLEKNGTFAEWQRYYKQLDALNELASSSQQQAAQAMAKEVADSGKAANKALKKNTDEMKNIIQEAAGNMKSRFEEMKQANKTAFGDLMQGPWTNAPEMQNRLEWGGEVRGGDLLKDLQLQNQRFSNFRNRLGALGKKGLPDQLLSDIQAMGPEAQDQINALNKMSPKMLSQYVTAWKKGQTLIKDATNQDMNRQIAQWQTHGKNVALAIIRGIQSEDGNMQKVFENMIARMFPGIAKQAGRKPGQASTRLPQGNSTYIYNNYGGQGMSVETWLRKMHFKERNKK